jgi:hypothetical protein
VTHRGPAATAVLAMKNNAGFIEQASVRDDVHRLHVRMEAVMDSMYKNYRFEEILNTIKDKFGLAENLSISDVVQYALWGGEEIAKKDGTNVFLEAAKAVYGDDYNKAMADLQAQGANLQELMYQEDEMRRTPQYHWTFGEEDPVRKVFDHAFTKFQVLQTFLGEQAPKDFHIRKVLEYPTVKPERAERDLGRQYDTVE